MAETTTQTPAPTGSQIIDPHPTSWDRSAMPSPARPSSQVPGERNQFLPRGRPRAAPRETASAVRWPPR
jgi:hypothetical protein